MARAFSFIHTADLHLGREFKGLLHATAALEDAVHDVIYRTFEDLVSTCIERRVDFLIVSGDTFDGQNVSYKAFSVFMRGMKRLDAAGIAVYLCTGNHDHSSLWEREIATLPACVHVFPSNEAGAFLHEDARTGEPLALLVGRSWSVNRPLDDLSAGLSRAHGVELVDEARIAAGRAPLAVDEALGLFAIGVLHTGLSLSPEPTEIKPAELKTRGIDYWALGHIHQPPEAYRIPPLVYPGSPQGMQKKDEGMQSVCAVRVDAYGSVTIERVPTARLIWQQIVLDVSACETLLDIEQALEADPTFSAALELHRRRHCGYIIRLLLVGTSPVFDALRDARAVGDFLDTAEAHYQDFHFIELENRVHPPIDRSKLAAEGLFPAVVIAQAAQMVNDSAGLERILEELERVDGLDYRFRECTPADLLEQATDDCLDRLLDRGDAR